MKDYLILHAPECECSTCHPQLEPPTRLEWEELVARVQALERAVRDPGLYPVGPPDRST